MDAAHIALSMAWNDFVRENQRPCQNDAHENGTYETRLSSPQHIADAKREGRDRMQCADVCAIDLWSVRCSVVSCEQLMAHADVCRGRIGVRISE